MMTNHPRLRSVGHYQELGCEDLPMALRLADSRGMRPAEGKDKVVQYLRSGKVHVVGPGRRPDAFDPTKLLELTVVTDGYYKWDRALAHYVEKYDVYLPPAFEAHMQAMNWRMPDPVVIERPAEPFVEPTADFLAAHGVALEQSDRLDEAAIVHRRVLEAYPNHPRSLCNLGIVYLKQRRFDDALRTLQRANEVDPTNAAEWLARAVADGSRPFH